MWWLLRGAARTHPSLPNLSFSPGNRVLSHQHLPAHCPAVCPAPKPGCRAPIPLSCRERLPDLDPGLIPGQGAAGSASASLGCAATSGRSRNLRAAPDAAHLGELRCHLGTRTGEARDRRDHGKPARTGIRIRETQSGQRDSSESLIWETAPGGWHAARWEFQGVISRGRLGAQPAPCLGSGPTLGTAGFDLS